MPLALKNEYKDVIIEINKVGFATIVFDPFRVNPKNYNNFIQFGFDFLFEEKEELTIEQEVENYING